MNRPEIRSLTLIMGSSIKKGKAEDFPILLYSTLISIFFFPNASELSFAIQNSIFIHDIRDKQSLTDITNKNKMQKGKNK